jgi:hypothetical protein
MYILCNTVTHLQNIYTPSAIPAAWLHFTQSKHFYGNLISLATIECTLVFMHSARYFCTISTMFESSGQSSMKVTNYQISRIIRPVAAMQIYADLGRDWHDKANGHFLTVQMHPKYYVHKIKHSAHTFLDIFSFLLQAELWFRNSVSRKYTYIHIIHICMSLSVFIL